MLRLGDIAREYGEKLRESGYSVDSFEDKLIATRNEVKAAICWRETTGPITRRIFNSIIPKTQAYTHYIVLCTGFYTKQVLSYVLTDSRLKGKTLLFEAGLRDYMDDKLKPRILKTKNKELNNAFTSILDKYGIKPSRYTCEICGKPLVAACSVCGKLLCHNHMIICPICGATFCNPETTGNTCFLKHKCR